MSKGDVNFEDKNIEYYTPKYIVNMFGDFDYDPATTEDKAVDLGVKFYDTEETNGLLADWSLHKKIWVNPPFNIKHLFFQKAVDTYKQVKNDIYFLCPIEFLTTKRFYNAINGIGVKIFIPSGRIKFESGVGLNERSPAFGSVIVKLQDKNEVCFFDLTQVSAKIKEQEQ